MFYNVKTQELVSENAVFIEDVGSYFLDKLTDEELKELGFARVVVDDLPEIDRAKYEIKTGQKFNEEKNELHLFYESILKPLEELKALKLAEINQAYERALRDILGEEVPESEMLTWSEQERESKSYQLSKNEADAPMMSVLAKTRGLSLDELCEKALKKAEAYRMASASLVGKRQALQDRIERAEDFTTLEAIIWE